MKEKIKQALTNKISSLISGGSWNLMEIPTLQVERPKDFSHGDYTVNVGFVLAKSLGKSPAEITADVIESLIIDGISEIAAVGGYINFTLSDEKKKIVIQNALMDGADYGRGDFLNGQKIMVEYTDPNPFKVFHIGHLMPNTIGESLACLFEFSGARVIRANYQGDVGRHVAMALWGMMKLSEDMPGEQDSLDEKTTYLGKCYSAGNSAFENDDQAKEEIIGINKAVYEKSDPELEELYEKGRRWSLEKFEEIYAILGTQFDEYFFESETWETGKKIVHGHTPEIFEESQGATIFDGEKYDLHKRVFINSQGLTTYEAKDVGLAQLKRDRHECDLYINVTAVEQNPYFGVVFKAIELVDPWFEGRLQNVAHGLLQLQAGKMSSRSGNVISGMELIQQAQKIAQTKISEKVGQTVGTETTNSIAVAGIKFNILKQALGKNSIYDPTEALSLEGDSGPYLQYTYVRAQSVLAKAREQKLSINAVYTDQMQEITYLLDLFPEIVARAASERAPHLIANYLLDLAHAFNTFYAKHKIIGESLDDSQARLALTKAISHVMKNGLGLLGIKTPQKM